MNTTKSIIIIVVAIIIVVLLGLSVASHKAEGVPEQDAHIITNTSDTPEETKPMDTDTNKRTLEHFTPVANVDALQKIDLVVGTGEEVKGGATVSVHYTGAVAATGDIFQSSKDFGTEPVTFPLGNVIKGWTDGIPGMKVGGTRRLVIPSAQAYGANPPPHSGIPANADLVFDVTLVSIGK